MKTRGFDLLRPPRGRPMRGRRQMRTRRRWTWRTLLHAPIPHLVVLAVVLGGLYALATSSVFAIKTVDAVGAPELQYLVQQNCACLERNIFFERPDAIRARITSNVPWVDVRQVYARLPNRIVIDATYRQPAVIWRTKVTTYTVAADGTVLYELKAPPVPAAMVPTTATAPLIFSPNDTTFPPPAQGGGKVPEAAVQMALATKRGLNPDLARTIDRFHWSPYSGLAAHSTRGWWAFLGIFLNGDLQQRLTDLEQPATFTLVKQDNCNYIDLQVLPNAHCSNEGQWGPRKPLGPGS